MLEKYLEIVLEGCFPGLNEFRVLITEEPLGGELGNGLREVGYLLMQLEHILVTLIELPGELFIDIHNLNAVKDNAISNGIAQELQLIRG